MTKGLPCNIEAEQAVLCCMLYDEYGLLHAIEVLNEDDFYRHAHQVLFGLMRDMVLQGKYVDRVTVHEELFARNLMATVGGMQYILTLLEVTPTSGAVAHYCEIVREKAERRRLIQAATQIQAMAADEDAENVMDAAVMKLIAVQKRQESHLRHVRDIAESLWQRMEAAARGERQWAAGFGLGDLDRQLDGGIAPGELGIVVADTSHGKTVMELMAVEAACEQGISCLLYSGEMSGEDILLRIICSKAKVNSRAVRSGTVGEDIWKRLSDEFGHVYNYPLEVMDVPPTITDIEVTTRRWALRTLKESQRGLVVVDYLQLVEADRTYDSETAAASKVVRSIKSLARTLNIPVVSASQIRKRPPRMGKWGDEKPDGNGHVRFPALEDVFGSGETVKSPDKVIILVNPPEKLLDSQGKRPAFWRVAKNRNGETGQGTCWFYPAFTRFVPMDTQHEEPWWVSNGG